MQAGFCYENVLICIQFLKKFRNILLELELAALLAHILKKNFR